MQRALCTGPQEYKAESQGQCRQEEGTGQRLGKHREEHGSSLEEDSTRARGRGVPRGEGKSEDSEKELRVSTAKLGPEAATGGREQDRIIEE